MEKKYKYKKNIILNDLPRFKFFKETYNNWSKKEIESGKTLISSVWKKYYTQVLYEKKILLRKEKIQKIII